MKDYKRIIVVFIVLIMILVTGVVGYGYLLKVSFLDALYMTVITISTVGYKEIADMTPEAKMFSIFIIFLGLSFVGYLFTSIAAFLLEGNMKKIIQKRRLRNKMSSLENHYIICGAGETGSNVILQFEKFNVPYIVIDNNREEVDELLERGIIALYGDATNEEVLIEAGIMKARGLISSLPTDAENVFTVLTSRYLNKHLYIISRSFDNHSREKLTRAGANRTISPNEIGGRRMAALMLRPTVISFLDLITHIDDVDLDLEEVILFPGSNCIGKSLREAQIPNKTGLVILALRKKGSDQMIFNPGAEVILDSGDTMIALGTSEQVMKLKAIAKDIGKRELMHTLP
ncbi:MAG: potassium channel family protein [Eubacteriales bacterium]